MPWLLMTGHARNMKTKHLQIHTYTTHAMVQL